MAKMNLLQAVNNALETAMADNDRVVCLGEDIGKFGGVFRATSNLQEKFGRDRVFNTPLTEQGIAGFAIGLAAQGAVPVAEIQFAGGAKRVRPVHTRSDFATTLAGAKNQINQLDFSPNAIRVGSAHVMGGCAMGANESEGVVDAMGQSFHLSNLSIMDGSTFPTSIGANPQLSIYGMVAKQATALAKKLT